MALLFVIFVFIIYDVKHQFSINQLVGDDIDEYPLETKMNLNLVLPTILQRFFGRFAGITLFSMDRMFIGCVHQYSDCIQLNDMSRFHFAVDSSQWDLFRVRLYLPSVAVFLIYIIVILHGNPFSPERHKPNTNRTADRLKFQWNRTMFVVRRMLVVNDTESYVHFPGTHSVAMPKFRRVSVRIFGNGSDEFQLHVPKDGRLFQWLWDRGRLLECRLELAVEFQAKFATATQKIPNGSLADLALMRNMLIEFRMTPMIFGGTLLGWYRECGIISHTTDLDIATFASEYSPPLLARIMADKRLKFHTMFGKVQPFVDERLVKFLIIQPSDSLEISVHAGRVKIDLFFIYHNGLSGSDWVGDLSKCDEHAQLLVLFTISRWNYPKIVDVCAGLLKGYLMYMPCNVEEILKADYGEHWEVPHLTKDFVWYSSHKNVQNMGTWNKSEWKSVFKVRV